MASQSLVPPSIIDKLPAMVRSELGKLSAEKQGEFVEEYRRQVKSIGVAYIALFFLGWHYAYLGKWGWQVLFWVTAGGLAIWWFISLFLIPGMIHNYNKDVAVNVLRNLKAISG